MITPYSGHDLADAFSVIDRLSLADNEREWTALVLRIDTWLSFEDPIPLPDSGPYHESGCRLSHDSGGVWLLKGGRFLTAGSEPDQPPAECVVTDDVAPNELLAAHLREHALRQFLDLGFDDLSAPTVPVIIRDLAALVPDLLPASRAFVLASLGDGMREGDGWNSSFARLRACFERGLADHDGACVNISAGCLVRLAAGVGPTPPEGDPRRGVLVLFVSPRLEVRRAALAAMDALPQEALSALVDSCRDRVDDCLADADPETRRLAGQVLRRLHAGDVVSEAAVTLESSDDAARLSVLDGMAELSDDRVALLITPAIQALDDDDDRVRDAAESALRGVAQRPALGHQALLALLTADLASAASLGLDLVEASKPSLDDSMVDGLSAVLGRPWESTRPRAAELLCDRYRDVLPDEAQEGYEALLRNIDPEVRRVALRRIARDVADRVQLREGLFPVLTEHVRDPHPELRVEAALTVVELKYPGAVKVAMQLAYDPDPVVRSSVAHVVAKSGDVTAHDETARVVGLVDTVFDFASSGTGDDRVRWKAALDALTDEPTTRTPELLVGVLLAAPDDHGDSFLQFAFGEIDTRLLGLLPEGDALVAVCRRLVQPPHRQVKHAARLAGARASHDPLSFDFLWTLYAAGERGDREAARQSLAAIAPVAKSAEVVATMTELSQTTPVSADRDLLLTMLHNTKGP